jgi:hypothetical protein
LRLFRVFPAPPGNDRRIAIQRPHERRRIAAEFLNRNKRRETMSKKWEPNRNETIHSQEDNILRQDQVVVLRS